MAYRQGTGPRPLCYHPATSCDPARPMRILGQAPSFVKVLPWLAFASGAAALTYESLWMRSFGLIFGVTTHAVSVTLCTFMGGLALGSWLVSRLAVRRILPAYAAVEAGIGLSALLTLPILRALPAWYGSML